MLAQAFAADGQPQFQHFDRIAQSQRVALDGGGVVRPDGGDLFQELVADVG
jgi:hypothetical protein